MGIILARVPFLG